MAVGSACGGGCRKTGASRTHPVDSSGLSGQCRLRWHVPNGPMTTRPNRAIRPFSLPNDIVWTLMGQDAFRPMPGIVLAGGRSLRMGRPKALLPWPTTQVPLVLHVTETLRDAGIEPLGVVTGEHHQLIAPILAGTGVEVLFNARHSEGQLSSLLHGLRWAFSRTDGDWVLWSSVKS